MKRLLLTLLFMSPLTTLQLEGNGNSAEASKLIKVCKAASKIKTAGEKIRKYGPGAESAKVVPHLIKAALKNVKDMDADVFQSCWTVLHQYQSAPVKQTLLDQLASSKNRDEKVFCLTLLSPLPTGPEMESTRKQAVKIFLSNLKDSWWPTRLAACRAMSGLRDYDIGTALTRLVLLPAGKEKRRIQEAARQALATTWTGAPSLTDEAERWGLWWVDTLKAEQQTVPEDLANFDFSTHLDLYSKRFETIEYFGTKIRSDAFILVTDYSNSMGPSADLRKEIKGLKKTYGIGKDGEGALEKITLDVQTKHECVMRKQIELLALMPSQLMFNLVYFNGDVTSFKPIKKLSRADTKTKNEAIEFLTRKAGLSHGTKLYEGLSLAFENEEADEFFILSDGRPFNSKMMDTQMIERACFRWQILRQAKFNCVDLGPILGGMKWNNPAKKASKMKPSVYLENIAKQSGGQYTLYETLKGMTFYVPAEKSGS